MNGTDLRTMIMMLVLNIVRLGHMRAVHFGYRIMMMIFSGDRLYQ